MIFSSSEDLLMVITIMLYIYKDNKNMIECTFNIFILFLQD